MRGQHAGGRHNWRVLDEQLPHGGPLVPVPHVFRMYSAHIPCVFVPAPTSAWPVVNEEPAPPPLIPVALFGLLSDGSRYIVVVRGVSPVCYGGHDGYGI